MKSAEIVCVSVATHRELHPYPVGNGESENVRLKSHYKSIHWHAVAEGVKESLVSLKPKGGIDYEDPQSCRPREAPGDV